MPPSQSSSGRSDPKQWRPDVYTPPFVPAYLQAINTLPAVICPALSPPSINYHAFVSSFSGTSFLRPLPPPPPIPYPLQSAGGTSDARRRKSSISAPKDLTPAIYTDYFFDLLAREIDAQHKEMQRYNLYHVPIYREQHDPCQFRVDVPGIREGTPAVQLGDLVKLRPIRPPQPQYGFPGGFTGYQYDTYVYGLDRTVGYIVLRADNLALEPGAGFNVSFVCQEKAWHGATRAIDDVGIQLKTICGDATGPGAINRDKSSAPTPTTSSPPAQASGHGFLRRMLFPEKEDGVLVHNALSKGVFNRTWFDQDLNYEQQKAVDAIMEQDYGNIPFLLWGPPGTGKTKTIVEIALQLIFTPSHPKHHILLCAPSQEAADTLAIRLSLHLNRRALFRLQNTSRTFAEVSDKVLPFCHIENDMFSLPGWTTLMRYRVVVCTTKDAEILVEARCTNRDLCKWEKSIVDSLRGISEDDDTVVERGNPVNHCHWSALLIDEAAQGIEPDVAIPLSIVAPLPSATVSPIVVMAGDQRQLGPRLATRGGALEESLFERLFARPVYAEHPLARSSYRDDGAIRGQWGHDRFLEQRRKLLPYIRPPFSNLVRTYRSHPAILAIPSALFYHDTLIPEARNTDALEGWSGWCGRKGIPLKFVLNSGLDESHEEGVSFYNLSEVSKVVEIVRSLVTASTLHDNLDIRPEEIAVMAPFREQVKRLRKALRSAGYRDVNVGPIESYQGSEHRFVIICTTRARARFLESDYRSGKGLVHENRRVNVALTRAKHGLIVIGNPWILERDSSWKAYMSFCWRHHAIQLDERERAEDVTVNDEKAEKAKEKKAGNWPPIVHTHAPKHKRVSSTASMPDTPPVNTWKPPEDDRDTPQYISRLETALVYKSKARNGDVFGENRGWDEDEPMWTLGLAAEEAIRMDGGAI